ncbi:hypothetical protein TNCV_4527381 [Trichonephila clavipes]|nr:hypothetical protein TNCV_4527381 [Trichonephila clavipes]
MQGPLPPQSQGLGPQTGSYKRGVLGVSQALSHLKPRPPAMRGVEAEIEFLKGMNGSLALHQSALDTQARSPPVGATAYHLLHPGWVLSRSRSTGGLPKHFGVTAFTKT